MKKPYKTIYKYIKNADKIVLARHVGPDPDALASTLALKDIILNKFPKKQVYVVGTPASKFRYMGLLDKFTEDLYEDTLLIVLDTPDTKRVDGVDPRKFKTSIKIDHHPFIETFCTYEWIDDQASSASQMIIEFCFEAKLKIPSSAAEKLYIGIVADTNRFLHYYTTTKTFDLVSKLIKKTNIPFTTLYSNLYLKPIREIRFQGYIASNMIITENGLGYMKLDHNTLEEHDVDAATANNCVNQFDFIEEVLVWVMFSEDRNTNQIRCSIRSRGPVINEVASHFNGGGHKFASGARLQTFDHCDEMIEQLDLVCKQYKENIEE